MMKKPVLVGLLILAAIGGIMAYSMMNLTKHRVEVCVNFRGIERCKIARGATEMDAIRTATDNACGEIASGVTDTMACLRNEPSKLTVLE
jgi:hypothetical protein